PMAFPGISRCQTCQASCQTIPSPSPQMTRNLEEPGPSGLWGPVGQSTHRVCWIPIKEMGVLLCPYR
ncbi:cDNA sequence BC054059, isoform CRA_c, partial [Mus musculus]